MKFYLNNQEVKLTVSPSVKFTQDETPDTFSCTLQANGIEQPYTPMQSFIIEWDSGVKSFFYLVLDTVEVFSAYPKLYTHTLTLTQNIQELQKHIARNTFFTQPAQPEKTALFSTAYMFVFGTNTFDPYSILLSDSLSMPNNWQEPVVISTKEKISKIQYRYKIYSVRNSIDKSGDDIYSNNYLQEESGLLANFITRLNRSFIVGDVAFREEETLDKNINEWYDVPTAFSVEINALEGKKVINASINSVSFDSSLGGLLKDQVNNFIIHFEIRVSTYYYSAYDVLEIIAKQYAKNREYTNFPYLYNMPSKDSELGILLSSTIVPNMSFSQLTVYNIVSQVFNLYDAIFTLDENNVLGIEYLSDNNKPKLENLKISGYQSSLSDSNYQNKFLCNYQNAIQKVKYPTTSYALASSNALGTPQENDHLFKVPYSIDSIDKVELLLKETKVVLGGIVPSSGTDYKRFYIDITNFPLDLSYFIKESSIYSVLGIGRTYPEKSDITINGNTYRVNDFRIVNQHSSIPFTRGSTEINLAEKLSTASSTTEYIFAIVLVAALNRFFGQAFSNSSGEESATQNNGPIPYITTTQIEWDTVFLRMNYNANTNGLITIESTTNKYNGEGLVSQNDNNVDLNKLGLNILGVSYKSGEPILAVTHEITSPNEMIVKGSILEREDGKWYANICTYNIFNDKVIGNIEFTKNYNALALTTKINNQKRYSNISNELTTACKEWVNEYIYISNNPFTEENETTALGDNFLKLVAATLGYNNDIPYIDLSVFMKNDQEYYYIPTRFYSTGHNICFEMEYNSPISAGYTLTKTDGKYYNRSKNYTDENGFFDECDILFCHQNEEFNNSFPSLEPRDFTEIGGMKSFEYYKKPNEIFGLNYQLTFLSYGDDEIYIGQKFVQNNGVFNPNNREKLYIVDVNYQLSIYDEKVDSYSHKYEITSVVIVNDQQVRFNVGAYLGKIENWAIVDDDNNIYLASNSKKPLNNFYLYFISKVNRL